MKQVETFEDIRYLRMADITKALVLEELGIKVNYYTGELNRVTRFVENLPQEERGLHWKHVYSRMKAEMEENGVTLKDS